MKITDKEIEAMANEYTGLLKEIMDKKSKTILNLNTDCRLPSNNFSPLLSTEFAEKMRMKIPRKKKKVLKMQSPCIDTFQVMKFNWCFNQDMVKLLNNIKADLKIPLSNKDKNYIKNGLLTNPRFNNYFL